MPLASNTLRVLPVAIALVVAAGLTLASCGDQSGPRTLKLEIPAQSQSAASGGESTTIRAHVGDRLVVTNRDKYLHIVAEHPVRAGQTATIALTQPGSFKTGCSVHRARQTRVVVLRR